MEIDDKTMEKIEELRKKKEGCLLVRDTISANTLEGMIQDLQSGKTAPEPPPAPIVAPDAPETAPSSLEEELAQAKKQNTTDRETYNQITREVKAVVREGYTDFGLDYEPDSKGTIGGNVKKLLDAIMAFVTAAVENAPPEEVTVDINLLPMDKQSLVAHAATISEGALILSLDMPKDDMIGAIYEFQKKTTEETTD